MASTVVESSVIDAPIERVWPFVRSVDFRFLNVVAKSELLSGDGWAEVGSVRRLTYNDKQNSTRTYVLEELSDVTRQVVFSAMGATPKSEIAAASHTIRMRPITHPCNKTFVQFESSYSRDITPQMLEDSKNHKRSFFVALQRIVKEACEPRNQPQQLRGQPQQQQQPSRDQPQHEQTQFSGREPSQFGVRESSQIAGRESSRKPEGKSYGFTPLVGKMELQQQQQPPKRQSEREGKAKPTAESSSGGGFHLDPVFEARFPEQYDRPQYSIGAGTGGRVIPVTDLSTDTSPPQLTRQKAHSPSTTSSPFGPRGASAAAGAGQSAQRSFCQSPQNKPKVSKGKSQLMSELRRRAAEQKMEPAEVLEALNFDEIKWLGAQSAEKLWEIADKDKSGTLDRNEATNLVGHLMRRISEEENDLVHAVSKMFAEPGEPSSFASTQDFTNQLLDELAKKRPAATAELIGHLDKNRDGTIEKDEFRVLFSEWLRREVYSEMRSCFFG